MAECIETELQRAVIMLADELNYTRAAERLNITRSALTRLIDDLEHRLEFNIFRQNQRRLEVTEAGQIFVNSCRSFLEKIERAHEGITSKTQDTGK